jgi:hypothetical protein
MAALQHQRSVTWSTADDIEESRYELRDSVKRPARPILRYYAAWLWAAAIAISIAIWFGAAWLVSTFM